MNEPWYDRAAGFALRVVVVAGFAGALLTVPGMVEQQVAPEGVRVPSLGNRVSCPERKNGQEYAGWIATQSDSSKAPVRGACVYRTI